MSVPKVPPEDAIIFAMMLVSASDADMSTPEISVINWVLDRFPAMKGFDRGRLQAVVGRCVMLMAQRDGLHDVLKVIQASSPPGMGETVYAAAVEVAAADESLNLPEIRTLDLLREALGVTDEGASAIERAARARFLPLSEAENA